MPEAKKESKVETIKRESRGLRGPITDELADSTPKFSETSLQLLKHHGTYQQDDRDTRTERKKVGLDRDYMMMLRTKFPGGAISADQYLLCDSLCDKYGQQDLRITSRQDFQFHGVVKGNLRPLIHDLNVLGNMTTLGGCGDVCRNTMVAPVADIDPRYEHLGSDLLDMGKRISDHFMPTTRAYYDLWLDDEKARVREDGTVEFVGDEAESEVADDPIYGDVYLPRKFKIGIATDFDNSIDVYTQDIGVIACTEAGKITGYEILVGGGLGYTLRKPATYARLGTPLAHVQEGDVIPLLEAIVKFQRDYGDRVDRKHARLKYIVEEWGIDKVREKVYEYAGRDFPAPTGKSVSEQPDYLGWQKQMQPGMNYVGAWIENGRIRDFEGSFQFKSGLKEIISRFKPSVRLTPHHNIILADIRDEDVPEVKKLLDAYQIPTNEGITTLRRMEMACPALPLCGLAMAESERALPGLISKLEEKGHGDDDVVIRMSGCPNNCSRPRSAELGIVGSGSDRYVVYAGGDYLGTRMSEQLLEKVKSEQLPDIISTLLTAWKQERTDGERFGDWCHKQGLDALRGRVEEAVPAG